MNRVYAFLCLLGLFLALNLLPVLPALLSGCRGPDVADSPEQYLPTPRDCSEFFWVSDRGPDLKMQCRILWCVTNRSTTSSVGGPTTLWCEPIYKGVRGSFYYGENVDPKVVQAYLDDAGPLVLEDRQ